MDVYVPIKPYTVNGQGEQEFNNLRVYVSYRKGSGFIVGYHPGWVSKGLGWGWGCVFDFGKNPLTSGAEVLAVPASKNSQKLMQAMYDLLNEADARTLIAELFNERDYNALTTALRNIATTPGWAKQELASIHAHKEDDNTTSTSTTKNSTTMANVEINADMVGRVLVMGSGFATYTIQSVSDEKVVCLFRSEGRPDIPIPMKRGDFEKLLASGNVHWQDEDEDEQPKQEQPKAETTKAETKAEDEVEEVDAEEVEDEPKQEPVKPKLRVVTGKIVQEKVREQPIEDDTEAEEVEDEDEPVEEETEDEPKAEQPKSEPKRTKRTTAKGKYFIVPYTTKKGKEAVKIAGFSEDDEIRARGGELHAAKTCERIKGKKYYELMFGPRYSEAARAMCDALNAGTDFDELLEIVETNTEALAQKRAEQKAEYFEKKAEREKKRAEKEAAKSETKSEPKATATKAAAKGEKLYTEAEVKERIRNAFKALADATGGNVADFEPLIEAA